MSARRSHRLRYRRRFLWLGGLTVALASCALHLRLFDGTHGFGTAPQMRAVLGRSVPAGTPLAEARRRMEAFRFTCSVSRNGSWVNATGPRDFLYCSRTDFAGPLVSRTWQAALFLDGDRVTDIDVTVYLTGV